MGKNYKGKNKGKSNGKAYKDDRRESAGTRANGSSNGYASKYVNDHEHSNDPAWWNQTTPVFSDAVKVPFNRFTGYPTDDVNIGIMRYDEERDNSIQVNENVDAGVVIDNPAIMVVGYVPGIGRASSYTDAPNRAFQAIYSKISSTTTGAIQFTQGDISMFCACMQSIAQNIALAKRAINTAKLYSSVNGAYPRAILAAQGFDPDSVIDEQANVRMALNNVIGDFNTLPVLNIFPMYTRQYRLANSIYMDQEGARAQTYIFRPDVYYFYSDLGFYDFDSRDYDKKARAVAQLYPWAESGDLMNLSHFIGIIEKQIRFVRTSSNFQLLAGGIMRAFTDSAFLRISICMETDVQDITYDDPWISYQIHNMTYAGTVSGDMGLQSGGNPNVEVDTTYQWLDISMDYRRDILQYDPYIKVPSLEAESGIYCPYTGYENQAILNTFEAGNPSADWLMESTRLTSSWQIVDDPDGAIPYYAIHPKTGGISTEFVSNVWIYTADGVDDWVVRHVEPIIDVNHQGIEAMETILLLERFHKAPRVLVHLTDTGWWKLTGDLFNWTTLSASQLRGINTAALLSIFGLKF